MTWQPIETAPKDGTRVLVYGARYISIAWWNKEPSIFEREIDACWTVFAPEDYFYAEHLLEEDAPTHWQPLPEPPVAEGALPATQAAVA